MAHSPKDASPKKRMSIPDEHGTTNTNDAIYTLARLATMLDLSERMLADHARQGRLKGLKVLRKWYFLHSDVVRWMITESNEHAPS
jgi:hypothetical protein